MLDLREADVLVLAFATRDTVGAQAHDGVVVTVGRAGRLIDELSSPRVDGDIGRLAENRVAALRRQRTDATSGEPCHRVIAR